MAAVVLSAGPSVSPFAVLLFIRMPALKDRPGLCFPDPPAVDRDEPGKAEAGPEEEARPGVFPGVTEAATGAAGGRIGAADGMTGAAGGRSRTVDDDGIREPERERMIIAPAPSKSAPDTVNNQKKGIRRRFFLLTANSMFVHTASEGLNSSSSIFRCTSFSNLGSYIVLIFVNR